jgi:GH15 family glucan-1,4-alpha-glucosidase
VITQAAIEDHGLIGDLQTAALVTTDGTIDWYCCPRFDSPSVFASILDAERGGYFRIAPEGREYRTRQLYMPNTAILITRFIMPSGVGEVIDFMPPQTGAPTDSHDIVRAVRSTRGRVRFRLDCQPRFDYGRGKHEVQITGDRVVFHNHVLDLALLSAPGPADRPLSPVRFERNGDGVTGTIVLDQGEVGGVVLRCGSGSANTVFAHGEPLRRFEETVRFWEAWLRRSTYTGRWREMVQRSAITLKLMTYAPTGGLVAAPTASLPEQTGGERNWDYRYTWIRDSSFSVYALLGLGFVEEAEAFAQWLSDRFTERHGNGSDPLRIMYRVDGSADLVEEDLDHLDGWRGSHPVRVGNGAADQRQLDIYGEALDAIYLAVTHGIRMTHEGWQKVSAIVDWVCDHWDEPEEGIWETRGGRQDFTYGRFQAWIALDRALRLADLTGKPSHAARWAAERDRIYDQIMDRGWNAERQAFVQHYGTDVLDASMLLMPLAGFVAPNDPMWQATLAAMGDELVSDSLVYRYNPSASPDGLRGSEGTFSMCSFWYVDALARSGYLDDARMVFEKMLTYANHLGLYSEEIGITGEQLGNFPQAFSHLALINAAINLDYQLDHGPGTVNVLTEGTSAAPRRRASEAI